MTDEQTRILVEGLLRDYVHCLDDGRLDDWPEMFTEKCQYKIISRDSHARGEPVGIYYCESRDMMRDRVLALRETSIYESHCYRHIISATRLTNGAKLADGAVIAGAVTAETGFVVHRIMRSGETTTFCTGKYVDRVEIVDGAAKFSEKLVLTDSSRYDMMLAIPL